jgi:hypothetical protein
VTHTAFLMEQRNNDAGHIANMDVTEDFCNAIFWKVAF